MTFCAVALSTASKAPPGTQRPKATLPVVSSGPAKVPRWQLP
ncbi:MAG: hypothetical protein AB7P21_06965 [Lautropia sp.]